MDITHPIFLATQVREGLGVMCEKANTIPIIAKRPLEVIEIQIEMDREQNNSYAKKKMHGNP